MHKKIFIALADAIRDHNRVATARQNNGIPAVEFTPAHLETIADFCISQNSAFKRDRWMDYVAGNCGPNGGEIKK